MLEIGGMFILGTIQDTLGVKAAVGMLVSAINTVRCPHEATRPSWNTNSWAAGAGAPVGKRSYLYGIAHGRAGCSFHARGRHGRGHDRLASGL